MRGEARHRDSRVLARARRFDRRAQHDPSGAEQQRQRKVSEEQREQVPLSRSARNPDHPGCGEQSMRQRVVKHQRIGADDAREQGPPGTGMVDEQRRE